MTTIQWTDETWNPVTGCTRVSEGCRHCYIERTPAFRMAGRKFVNGKIPLVLHHDRLNQPLHWKKPRRVFVNSLSDLFHEDVPDGFTYDIFRQMARCQRHTFQILTKRPERMRRFCRRICYIEPGFNGHNFGMCSYWPNDPDEYPIDATPLPNVWLGVSIEDQRTADERIPILLQTPAAVRFTSAEPLLGPVDLERLRTSTFNALDGIDFELIHGEQPPRLNWVIVGGESGPGARPCDLAWIRSIVQQCRAVGIACFTKQLGAYVRTGNAVGGQSRLWLKDKKGGAPQEWPEDLRVREWPR